MTGADGNGWVVCDRGDRHWGRYGAAGLLVTAPGPAGDPVVLLQLRAAWSHFGGTWGLPGGARDGGESARDAAVREAGEETTLDLRPLRILGEIVDAVCSWSYTTVLAELPAAGPVHTRGQEGDDVRWVPLAAVPDRPLHPRLAELWPGTAAELARLRAANRSVPPPA